LPFKCNLQRYSKVPAALTTTLIRELWRDVVVGLCTLNQVDQYPIAYNLSNP
jgi:hypothetical protein